MTVFERITESLEVLGKFLACLPVVEGPWDDKFHGQFCTTCPAKDCDACPPAAERNNPGWWLILETDSGHADKYAVIVTYHDGARIGAVVEAKSMAGAWIKAIFMFNPQIVAALEVSQILPSERGSAV